MVEPPAKRRRLTDKYPDFAAGELALDPEGGNIEVVQDRHGKKIFRALANAIDLDRQELEDALTDFCQEILFLPEGRPGTLDQALQVLGIEPGNANVSTIWKHFRSRVAHLSALELALQKAGLLNVVETEKLRKRTPKLMQDFKYKDEKDKKEDKDGTDTSDDDLDIKDVKDQRRPAAIDPLKYKRQGQLQRILDIVYSSMYQCFSGLSQERQLDGEQDLSQTGINPFLFSERGGLELESQPRLYSYCLEKFALNGLRRYGDMVYQPILVKGRPTRAFRERGTISEIIDELADHSGGKDAHEMWLLKVHSNKDRICKFLREANDFDLIDLVKERGITAWKSHLYISDLDLAIPYTSPVLCDLKQEIAACKKFKVEMHVEQDYKNPLLIPNPLVDVLAHQGYTEEEMIAILGIAGGRNQYTPRTKDRFEVFAFFLGAGGAGKSTFIDAVKDMFEVADVGAFGNSMQPTFGLEALANKMLFVADDINANCNWPLASFNTMTSFEPISVARKYHTALQEDWKTPGIAAGNQLPRSLMDVQGNVLRRLFLIHFLNHVPKKDKDTNLATRIKRNYGRVYRSFNLCYKHVLEQVGTRDFWASMPAKFRQATEIIKHNNNPLAAFLDNRDYCQIALLMSSLPDANANVNSSERKVELMEDEDQDDQKKEKKDDMQFPELYCSMESFLADFDFYRSQRNLASRRVDQNVLETELRLRGCRVVYEERRGEKRNWIIGLKLQKDIYDQDLTQDYRH